MNLQFLEAETISDLLRVVYIKKKATKVKALQLSFLVLVPGKQSTETRSKVKIPEFESTYQGMWKTERKAWTTCHVDLDLLKEMSN